MMPVPEQQPARVGELRRLLRINLPGDVTQIDKINIAITITITIAKPGLQVLIRMVRDIHGEQRAMLIQPHKHKLLYLFYQMADTGLGQVDRFGGGEIIIAPAHQVFIAMQNKNATLLSRPLLLKPEGVLARFAGSIEV
jgi:hypothetical protein